MQGGDAILYECVMMHEWHNACAKIHRTLMQEEWILVYAHLKHHLGGQGIPGQNAECHKII